MKKVLITGVTGQDGAYLSKYYYQRATRFLLPLGEFPPQIFGDYKILEFLIKSI